jgi:hypothetical protein
MDLTERAGGLFATRRNTAKQRNGRSIQGKPVGILCPTGDQSVVAVPIWRQRVCGSDSLDA